MPTPELLQGPSTIASPKAVTPPPSSSLPNTNLELTPERVRQVELNRLRGTVVLILFFDRGHHPISFCSAKARHREKEASTTVASSSGRNANSKRPLSVVPAASGSPTAPSKKAGNDKLQRDARLGKYFDYDLSKMVNSKGGFLVEDDKEVDDVSKAKERERERQRAIQNIDPRTRFFQCCLSRLRTP